MLVFYVFGPNSYAKTLERAAKEDFVHIYCDVTDVKFYARTADPLYPTVHDHCFFRLEVIYDAAGFTHEDILVEKVAQSDSSIAMIDGSCHFTSESLPSVATPQPTLAAFNSLYVLPLGVTPSRIAAWSDRAVPDSCYRLKPSKYLTYKQDDELCDALDCHPDYNPNSIASYCLSVLPRDVEITATWMEEAGWWQVCAQLLGILIACCWWAQVRHKRHERHERHEPHERHEFDEV